MNVNEIRQWVNFELNKHQSGNTLNQEEYNLCLSWANQQYFKTKYGLPEQYRPGQPLPAQAFQVTQKIIDDMRPFLLSKGGKNLPQLKIDENGYANYPSDYIHLSSIRYNNYPIQSVTNDVLGDKLVSSIVAPSYRYPICCFYNDYIQFYPKDLKFVDFDYIRMPATPFWGADIIDDEYVYNPSKSVQLEWAEQTHIDIANLILGYASVNLRDFQVTQVSESRKDKGE